MLALKMQIVEQFVQRAETFEVVTEFLGRRESYRLSANYDSLEANNST
jgi:hypothetical protein